MPSGSTSAVFAPEDGVLAHALELVAISEAVDLMPTGAFSQAERAYALSKSDPERRLAARLAAKRAALRALGGTLRLEDVEVLRSRGAAPSLRLSPAARARLAAIGAHVLRVSLTHGQTHAAAVVLALRTS
jgi:phosphopantetheinyl transferase (holo-ACP synthase)